MMPTDVQNRCFGEDAGKYRSLREKAVELALKNLEHPDSPGWKTQMTCIPGMNKIWQWDSCFMALYALHMDGLVEPMNNLDNLYLCQREDGFMAMACCTGTGIPAFGEVINPPLFAWVEMEYYRHTGDGSRFERVFPVLERYYRWIRDHRRRPGSGLYFFESPGASGMDNSPRGGWWGARDDGSDISHIDLICQQLLSARCLAEIAEKLDNGCSDFFLAECEELVGLIDRFHWKDKTGFYYDVFERGRDYADPKYPRNAVPCKTAAAFWALVSGAANTEQADALERHLLDPEEFFTEHPVPSLSRDDPNYHASGMYWLGGVWPPVVYMVICGLKRYGKYAAARTIAKKHLDAMYRTYMEYEPHTIWECYAPEFMRPSDNEIRPCVRPDFVGWSGLGPIAVFGDRELWETPDANCAGNPAEVSVCRNSKSL